MSMNIKVLLTALAIVTLCSLLLGYVSAVDQSAADTVLTYSGVQMLLGSTGGRSAGALNPMLLLSVFCYALLLIGIYFRKDNSFMSIACSAVALVGLLMFLFDATFTDRREFNFASGTVYPQMGWWLGVAAAVGTLALSIYNKVTIGAAKRHNQRMQAYENRDLPAGYRDPTMGEIIRRDFKKHWPVYLMALPMVLFYIIWCYGPMYGIVIAFNNYKPKRGFLGSEWVGLDWYREFFRGPFAYRTIRNTLLISIYNLIIGFPAPILLALMLNEMRCIAYKRVVQTITYIPHFISLVVMAGLLIDFLSSDGVITTVLSKVFGFESQNYLGNAQYFRTVYIGSEIWQHLGWDSIIYLSALAGIDMELYEAARIDGAGKLKQTWHVTLPGIAPTITILLILRIGQLLSVGYEKIILIYNASIYETADVISTYVYRVGITDMSFSRSTAINTLNSVVNFMLVIMANKVSGLLSETSLW